MGCEGLLAQPWNVQEDKILREFKFERGNHWIGMKRRDPDYSTPDIWARVYGFQGGVGEGWTGRKDGMFVGKFREDVDPKEGLHPSNCQNPRERRMLECLMPILNPEKFKRISLTMANTLFGAMSGVWSVNWGLLIHEVVRRAILNIGRKPSYLSPFILYLYRHYDGITAGEEDLLTIAAENVTYKVRLTVADSSTSSDPISPVAPPSSPGSPPPRELHPPLRVSGDPSLPHLFFLSILIRKSDQPGVHVVEHGSFRLGLSGKPLQTRPRQTRGAPDPILPAETHHQKGQPRAGRLRTRKHPPGDSQEGGPEGAGPGEEGARPSPNRKCTHSRTGGRHVGRAVAEERGDPEVPRRADGGPRPDPETHRASG